MDERTRIDIIVQTQGRAIKTRHWAAFDVSSNAMPGYGSNHSL